MKHIKLFESFIQSKNESLNENFLQELINEFDLGDEIFDFQEEYIGLSPTREDAEKLYPILISHLEDNGVFEENPELKDRFEENKNEIIKGLIEFIEYSNDDN